MRILLRLIAGFTFLSVIGTILFVIGTWLRGGMVSLVHSGAFGVLTIAGWLITLVVGPPAAVLLWKQNDAGRIASIIVRRAFVSIIYSSWSGFGPLTCYMDG
jgi:hypothetical protein